MTDQDRAGVGMRFGSLNVLDVGEKKAKHRAYFLCACDCGAKKEVREDHLLSGAIISCGCVGRRRSATANRTHGMSRKRIYKLWSAMIERCERKENKKFHLYGAKGIRVCERWRNSFENFYYDMGEKPDGMSLDRIDPHGNYEPENCRWADPKTQARNKRDKKLIPWGGLSMSITEWAEATGINRKTISSRLRAGWSVGQAVSERVRGSA